ncbi:ATP-binding protein [Algirhabdus cladophorae]|uniref:ATP-binding protein n=1 Tax=Algirhabdus cladophorae TaxID=3377108 RepID=UPI003B849002
MAQNFAIYQQIVVPVLILELTPAGHFNVVGANDAWCVVAEMDEAHCKGRSLTEVFDARSAAMLEKMMIAVHRNGSAERSMCHMDLPQGPSWFDVSLRRAPIDADGIVRIVATMNDITDQQEVKNRLVQHYTHHLDMKQQMEQFMSFAAHDLRSPMRNVQMLAELLREDFVDHGDGKLEMIDMLEDIATKASNLIDDMLNYARASDLRETLARVELCEVCSDISMVLDPQGRHSIWGDAVVVETDPMLLRILLQNLIDNAIKYAGDQAEINVQLVDAPSGFVTLRVSDNGQGFDDPSVVFLSEGTFKVGSGFGLFGLKRLIEDRGGRIWAVAPSDEKGAVIMAEIPGAIMKAVA